MIQPPVSCITFDLDDTLWSVEPVIQRAEQALYRWFEHHCPEIAAHYSIDELRDHRRADLARRPDLRHDLTAFRRQWMARLFEAFGYSTSLADDAMAHFLTHRNRVTFFDGVIPLLERLGQWYSIGAITNGNAQLDVIGIAHLFDFIISSADVGAAKPDPAVFRAALAHAQVSPREAVHIGDDPEHDILGAAQVGMRTIWVNPNGLPWPGGPEPDLCVRALVDVGAVFSRPGGGTD